MLHHVTFLLLSTPSDEIRLHSEHRRKRTRRPENFSQRTAHSSVSLSSTGSNGKWNLFVSACLIFSAHFSSLLKLFPPLSSLPLSQSCRVMNSLLGSLLAAWEHWETVLCTVWTLSSTLHSAAPNLLTQRENQHASFYLAMKNTGLIPVDERMVEWIITRSILQPRWSCCHCFV